jgi:hypothetical protein
VLPPPVRSPETMKENPLNWTRRLMLSEFRSSSVIVTEPPLNRRPPAARHVAVMPPPRSIT